MFSSALSPCNSRQVGSPGPAARGPGLRMFRAAELDHSFPFATFTRVRQLLRLGWASTARSGTRFRFRFGFRFAEAGCVSSLTFLPLSSVPVQLPASRITRPGCTGSGQKKGDPESVVSPWRCLLRGFSSPGSPPSLGQWLKIGQSNEGFPFALFNYKNYNIYNKQCKRNP